MIRKPLNESEKCKKIINLFPNDGIAFATFAGKSASSGKIRGQIVQCQSVLFNNNT